MGLVPSVSGEALSNLNLVLEMRRAGKGKKKAEKSEDGKRMSTWRSNGKKGRT